MKDRIRMVRKNAGLTMEQFGQKIGVGKSAISNIENGHRGITDQMARSISREFNVNENWLRTGDGAPYIELTRKEKIAEFFGDVLNDGDDDSFKVQVVELLANLDADDWRYLADMLKRAKEKD